MDDQSDNFQNLEKKVNKALDEQAKTSDKTISNGNPAIKILSELISGIAVGVFLGYFLDEYFNTKPLLLILCMLLGFSGSMLNIYKDLTK